MTGSADPAVALCPSFTQTQQLPAAPPHQQRGIESVACNHLSCDTVIEARTGVQGNTGRSREGMNMFKLKCPVCGVTFDFELEEADYARDSAQTAEEDYAPAECPNGHIKMYKLPAKPDRPA